ncbi:hypothetical protein LTS10_000820 [Elasticomyces elasticus]|nr:hypothetical protein LTS10_000820 [Elasticomyces elasticus]
MASSPLTTTPTDIMYMIFDLLPTTDLRDFRSVCRWAREQSNEPFASRTYREIRISSIMKGKWPITPVQRADRVLRNNTALAAAVRTLSIEWGQSDYRSGFRKTDFRLVAYSILEVPDIFSTLSRLTKLELHKFTSFTVARRFWLQLHSSADSGSPIPDALGASWPQVESLSITNAYLTSKELVALVQCAGPGLTELQLDEVHLFDGTWPDTLRAIHSTKTSMGMLELQDLWEQPKERSATLLSCFEFQSYDEARLNKSCGAGATLSLQHHKASMIGAESIKLGLDMFEEHAAARQ